MAMKLIDETHTYVNELKPEMQYTSVTTLIHKYCNEFDKDYHAERVAKRKGVSKEEILAEWQELNDQANIYGTRLHEICERYLLANRMYVARDSYEARVIQAFDDLGIIPDARKTKPEHIMSWEWDDVDGWGIAGTGDVIEDYDDPWTGEGYFNVWDFKTNKRFDFENKYHQYMHFPLEHHMDCHYSVYTLQLSIYALMYMRETGRKLKRMGLLYWDKQKQTFKMIPVAFMKRDAEAILNHYKYKTFG